MAVHNSRFKSRTLRIVKNLKFNLPCESPSVLPIRADNQVIANLRVVSQASLKRKDEIVLLARWRKNHERWFPSQFRVTRKGTRRWAHARLLMMPDRVLFMIEDLCARSIGHVGLYRFDYSDRSCEIDNIVRGKNDAPGIMTLALSTLIDWSRSVLQLKTLYLRVFWDNRKAIALYKRCGFKEIEKIPLKQVMEKHMVRWEEYDRAERTQKSKRYFLRMKLEC